MSEPTEDQINRLPNWARTHIRRLQRVATEAENKAQEVMDAQEVTRIQYGNVYQTPKYLPDGPYNRVRFNNTEHTLPEWVDFMLEGEHVRVTASHPLLLRMQASNTLIIDLDRR